jgi:cysteine synthase A
MSKGNSIERARMMRALGAEVGLVDQTPAAHHGEVSGDDLALVDQRADELVAERHAFRANQFTLASSALAHERHTGPELWRQSAGTIDVFVDFIGTAGSFTGIARHLKQQRPSLRAYVVDPATASHRIQGGGYSIDDLPLLDDALVDGRITVTDDDAIAATRDLAVREGVFAGFSTGACAHVALELLRTTERGATIAFLAADSGLKYLSTDLWD